MYNVLCQVYEYTMVDVMNTVIFVISLHNDNVVLHGSDFSKKVVRHFICTNGDLLVTKIPS